MQTHTLMALRASGADGNRDGLPTVLLEAMASGLPVVSTDVTGIPEMIRDGISGRIVAQRSPRQLAGAIDTLLAAPPTRASFVAAARADVEHRFDLDTNVATLAGFFEHARHVTRPRASTHSRVRRSEARL
jgi:glycosyltransferase involved in cell wall biosynthesis